MYIYIFIYIYIYMHTPELLCAMCLYKNVTLHDVLCFILHVFHKPADSQQKHLETNWLRAWLRQPGTEGGPTRLSSLN